MGTEKEIADEESEDRIAQELQLLVVAFTRTPFIGM